MRLRKTARNNTPLILPLYGGGGFAERKAGGGLLNAGTERCLRFVFSSQRYDLPDIDQFDSAQTNELNGVVPYLDVWCFAKSI